MAIRFDTSGEGLIRTSDLLSHNADFTMAGWFRMTTDTNTYATLFGIFSAGGEYDALETRNDGTTLLIVSNRTTFSQSSTILNMSVGTWYYIALTRSGNTLTGYVITQALSISSQTLAKNTSANSPSENTVGQWNDNTEVYNGRVMGIKFWSAALTQAELLNEMQSLLPRRFTNLYGFWPGFPGSGERTRDYSGNGRAWTESGTVSDEDPAPIPWGARVLNVVSQVTATAYTLTAAQGSFTLTGEAASLTAQRKLTAGQGAYSLTGQAANLLRGFYLGAAQGTFTLAGQASGLTVQRLLTASQGAFTLTGQNAGLTVQRLLSASQGSYALTGQAAQLLHGFALLAGQGSFTLTGQAAGLRLARLLTAEQGTYTLTGEAAGLRRGWYLLASQGFYTFIGYDAGLTYAGSGGAYFLTASLGLFTLTGEAASLAAARRLTAGQGAYVLTGQAAALLRGYRLGAGQGSYALTGEPAGLTLARFLTASQGTLTLTGLEVLFALVALGVALPWTLRARAHVWTLQDRDLAWTLAAREMAWTLQDTSR